MLRSQCAIVNKKGLHARASAELVALACRYQSHITLTYQEQSAAANSLIQLLMLGAACGAEVTVEVAGDDAQEALAAVEELIANGFNEDSH